ncbi:glycosyltransferase [Uliginosibacterium gangwonense]|uniref:glycosyltransferase n=1 Tax=Uliginosibacterium gangwonense TaxID=392736 RepID=UPI000372F0FD|nr:glycosyltransferase [Uliginosibacterium gangwonense]
MTRVHVCFVITALGVGGAEHALLKMLSRLDRTRFEPSLIVLGRQDDLLPRFQAIGIEPLMLRLRPGRWPFAEVGRFLAAVRSIQPDILQGWMYHGNLAASFAAARLNPKPRVCWSVRDTPDAAHAHSFFTRMVIRLSGFYVGRVAQIFNVSARSAEYCAQNLGWPRECTALLPNGVDTELFQPDSALRAKLRLELGVADDSVLVGMVARWSPVKNHALLLRAMAALRTKVPNAQCVLVGKGLDRNNAELMALIEQNGLAFACHLLGPRADVQTLYPAFDILALSSRSEGFPNVLVEAMSCGVPVVSTDVGDARQIVGAGGLIVGQDENEMAQALEFLCLLGNRQAMGRAAREQVNQHYGLDSVVEGLQARYLSLIADSRA